MKKMVFYPLLMAITAIQGFAGTLRGAWEMVPEGNPSGEKVVMVATSSYLSIAVFEKNTYIRSYGGRYEIKEASNGAVLELLLEFNDKHSETVGTKITYQYTRNGDVFTIENQLKTT
ncbi:MAG: hypothetical protein V4683_02490, partial [Bacteroidota bacterium]